MTEENHNRNNPACTNPDLCEECQEAHAMLMLMLWVGIVMLAFFAFVCTAILMGGATIADVLKIF